MNILLGVAAVRLSVFNHLAAGTDLALLEVVGGTVTQTGSYADASQAMPALSGYAALTLGAQ